MPHPFRVFDKLDMPILGGVVSLFLCGLPLGYSILKFLPVTFSSFLSIYSPYILIGVAASGMCLLPQIFKPITYEAEKTFALTGLQVEDETKRVFKQTPLVVHQHKEDWGWHIVYSLPKGLSYRQVMDKKPHLETALKAEVDMQWTGEYLHVDIANQEVPNYIEYFLDVTDWNEQEGDALEGLDEVSASSDCRGDWRGEIELPPPSDSNAGEI
jgi:hypothetical protein